MNNNRSDKNEQGVALVVTLLFLMALGVLSAALVSTSHNEMKTSAAYKYSQQAFYVANAGVQRSVEWYANIYGNPIPYSYDPTTNPVEFGSDPVLLAGKDGDSSVYPDESVSSDFHNRFHNASLQADSRNMGVYAVNATLVKHIPTQFLNPADFEHPIQSAIERWEISSIGYWGSAGDPLGIAQITAIVENSGGAFFDRALWGIDGVDMGGESSVDSYDPTLPLPNSGDMGAIGSNGDVTANGDITVKGDVACGPGGDIDITGSSVVTGDRIYLPEPRVFPPIPEFEAGTININIKPGGADTLTQNPTNKYGSITVKGTLTIQEGTYYIDELLVTSQGVITLEGPVTLFVKSGLEMEGQGTGNDPSQPGQLTVYYSGEDDAKWAGGSEISASVYAPNAELHLVGNSEFYGSFIGRSVDTQGGATVHFDQGSLNRHRVQQPFRLISWSQDSF